MTRTRPRWRLPGGLLLVWLACDLGSVGCACSSPAVGISDGSVPPVDGAPRLVSTPCGAPLRLRLLDVPAPELPAARDGLSAARVGGRVALLWSEQHSFTGPAETRNMLGWLDSAADTEVRGVQEVVRQSWALLLPTGEDGARVLYQVGGSVPPRYEVATLDAARGLGDGVGVDLGDAVRLGSRCAGGPYLAALYDGEPGQPVVAGLLRIDATAVVPHPAVSGVALGTWPPPGDPRTRTDPAPLACVVHDGAVTVLLQPGTYPLPLAVVRWSVDPSVRPSRPEALPGGQPELGGLLAVDETGELAALSLARVEPGTRSVVRAYRSEPGGWVAMGEQALDLAYATPVGWMRARDESYAVFSHAAGGGVLASITLRGGHLTGPPSFLANLPCRTKASALYEGRGVYLPMGCAGNRLAVLAACEGGR